MQGKEKGSFGLISSSESTLVTYFARWTVLGGEESQTANRFSRPVHGSIAKISVPGSLYSAKSNCAGC